MKTTSDPGGGVVFPELARELNLADRVVQSLRGAIVGGRLRPGDPLPSERELGDQFGVSRTVVREAIRSLSGMGLLEVRSGSGSRVASIDPGVVADSINLLLLGRGGFDYDKVAEVRAVLEVQVAGLAASRGLETEHDELRSIQEAMRASEDDPEAASELDHAFHGMLCRMTHNELYLAMLDAIGGVLMDVRRATLRMPGRHQVATEAHARIMDRVIARDVDGARVAMTEHLEDSRRLINAAVDWMAEQSGAPRDAGH